MYLFPHLIDISQLIMKGWLRTRENVASYWSRQNCWNQSTGLYWWRSKASLLVHSSEIIPWILCFFDAVLFAVHTLYGLHVLHVDIGAVHSDIPLIMSCFQSYLIYGSSLILNMPCRSKFLWIILDRNIALLMDLSLLNLKLLEFTEKSDVYSLGATIRCIQKRNMWKDLEKRQRGNKNALIFLKSLVNGCVKQILKKD